MAIPKTFKSVCEIQGVAEGPGNAFTVDWDQPQELFDVLHEKMDAKEAPAAAIVAAVQAARNNIPPHS